MIASLNKFLPNQHIDASSGTNTKNETNDKTESHNNLLYIPF